MTPRVPRASLGLAAVSAMLTRKSLFLASGLSLSDRADTRQTEVPNSSKARHRRKKSSRSPGSLSYDLMLASLLPGEFREEKKSK